MQRFLVGTVICALSTAAVAADFPERISPSVAAPVLTPVLTPVLATIHFAGFYVGAQAGWQGLTDAYCELDRIDANYFEPAKGTGSTFVGGIHTGYNYQSGLIVFGLETDIESTTHGKKVTLHPGTDGSWDYRALIRAQGSLRARLGVIFDRYLGYATAGVALANVHHDYSNSDGAYVGDKSRAGWTVGAGVEYALDTNWHMQVEYRYTALGTIINIWPSPDLNFTEHHHLTSHSIRPGVTYRF